MALCSVKLDMLVCVNSMWYRTMYTLLLLLIICYCGSGAPRVSSVCGSYMLLYLLQT